MWRLVWAVICTVISPGWAFAQSSVVEEIKPGSVEFVAPCVDTFGPQAEHGNANNKQKCANGTNDVGDIDLQRLDLSAQQGMNTSTKQLVDLGRVANGWASSSAIAAWFTVLFAGAAAWYARQSIKVSRSIGQAQTRAYLSIERLLISLTSDGQGGRYPAFNVAMRNSGNSPTQRLSVSISGKIGSAEPITIRPEGISDRNIHALSQRTVADILCSRPDLMEWFNPNSGPLHNLRVDVTARYSDVFGVDEAISATFAVSSLPKDEALPFTTENQQITIQKIN